MPVIFLRPAREVWDDVVVYKPGTFAKDGLMVDVKVAEVESALVLVVR